ncbi:CMP-N,N'-diacetyllegionaminic acid synthase [compost metagenome]
MDLDATSPLRHVSDIVEVTKLLQIEGTANVITGMPSRRSPYFNLVEINENGYVVLSKTFPKPIHRRQDAPQCFDMNASIYAWRRQVIMDEQNNTVFQPATLLYEMPEERSIDIDSELDWKFVELILKSRLEEI